MASDDTARSTRKHRPSVTWRVIEGDCVEAMRELPESSVDAVVCDPPYGLGFMGKDWDAPGGADHPMRRSAAVDAVNAGASRQGGRQRASEDYQRRQARDARSYQEWCEAWAAQALRALKPGGFMLAMGGTRTYHRLAAGVEDAGFEIRDMIEWLYGSGFPKHRSALKPAHEPAVLARKSLIGSVDVNEALHGTGALNIDGCRIGFRDDADERESKDKNRHAEFGTEPGGNNVYGDFSMVERKDYDAPGRWPANVVLDEEAAAMLDAQTGELVSGARAAGDARDDTTAWRFLGGASDADRGGASRFLYVAKPDSDERHAGLGASAGLFSPADAPDRNAHPTVKPIALMRWLIRLVTPPGGTVLDPFTGSGTTGCAALLEGFHFIGIEREAEYAQIARARIAHWSAGTPEQEAA